MFYRVLHHTSIYILVSSCTLGYNDFNILVLAGLSWFKNLLLRHIYKKSFPFFSAVSSAFTFKVCKMCQYDPRKCFFFSKIPFSFFQPSSFWPRHCGAKWPTFPVLGVGGSGAEAVGPGLQVDFFAS